MHSSLSPTVVAVAPDTAPGGARRAAITARQLARRFDEVDAVAGIDLDIAAGEIYGLLGPNGAGKSTTVRMLCTLLGPTGGSATVAGHDIVDEPNAVRLRIGAALQEAALDPKQIGRRAAAPPGSSLRTDVDRGRRARP